ncbi:Uncharacterised protein [Bordetella pertussis]|nr:Uncharacterised protein [Bordetella pertussis]CFE03674.1 Uncharacterised protein [Bordetella pertussis]CFL79498.1 Uncharacterised protein [Bordetella pertussis]CFL80652.1 Uncharacterised protein [Bordetella pertussis]CFL94258.1 Uncharacterised protein [Bordetella pertussis]
MNMNVRIMPTTRLPLPNSRIGIKGSRLRDSITAKASRNTAASASDAKMGVASQPSSGPCTRA